MESDAHPAGSRPPLRHLTLLPTTAAALLGVVAIAVGGRLEVPMVPVPMSLQTYAVGVVAGLLGWLRGGATVGLYLAAGAFGAPVFAGGSGGVAHLAGPTAGYLVGFAVAAVLVGALAERGWTQGWGRSILVMVLGHAVILGLGAAWLGHATDWGTAYRSGFEPFLIGAVAKSVLATATLFAVGAMPPRAGTR
ncbi:MAG: biotin transporter BioY [Acidobacteriota bacterium]